MKESKKEEKKKERRKTKNNIPLERKYHFVIKCWRFYDDTCENLFFTLFHATCITPLLLLPFIHSLYSMQWQSLIWYRNSMKFLGYHILPCYLAYLSIGTYISHIHIRTCTTRRLSSLFPANIRSRHMPEIILLKQNVCRRTGWDISMLNGKCFLHGHGYKAAVLNHIPVFPWYRQTCFCLELKLE